MSKTVLGVFWKNWNSDFFQKHPKPFCLYLVNQILLRGRFVFKTNGRIFSITSYKDHCCSFYTSWVINQWKSCILKISKKHPTLGVWCAPPKYFSEFYKLFLGFYKSQFSGTTFILVEKCLFLVYSLFKNSKKLTFVQVRRHKTLNGAIYIYIYIRNITGVTDLT